MSRKYFGTDGIRGEFGVYPLTETFFVNLGIAISKSLLKSDKKNKSIIFGSDTRESSNKIVNLISRGLSVENCKLHNAGIVPTPAIAYYVKENKYDLGIMVSASHNPYKDNGIKIFNNLGIKISVEDEKYIENYIEIIEKKKFEINSNNYKLYDVSEKVASDYISFCLRSINSLEPKNTNITLDLANGANYKIAKKVFSKAGFNVTTCNDNPNGKNINLKCGSTYLKKLPEIVKSNNSSFGLSMDGDGDRLIVVDSSGKIFDGDDILYTIIKGKKNNNEKINGVVGTTMTNFALEKYLEKENIPFIRANVGDKFILKKMNDNNYELGGETSGHVLMLEHTNSGDSIIAALQFLRYSDILYTNKTDNLLKKYPQKITNLYVDKDLPDNIIDITIKEAVENFEKQDLRLIIRKSGTENCIRIMAESKNINFVNSVSEDIKNFIAHKLKTLS